MKKILKFGVAATALAVTCAGSAMAAPPVLGSPQQNFGIVPAGQGMLDDHYASTTTTNSHLVGAAGQRTLFGVQVNNTVATLEYLHFYNGTAAPTCSATTNLELSITIPTSTITYFPINNGDFGEKFPLGMGYCLTHGGADGDTSTAVAGVYVDVFYK